MLAVAVDKVELLFVTRLEHLTPQRRGEHQAVLRAEIIPEADGVHAALAEIADHLRLETVDHVDQDLQPLGLQIEILHGLLEPAQERDEIQPGDDELPDDVLVGMRGDERRHVVVAARRVGVGRLPGVEVLPFADRRLLRLPHRVVQPLPAETPFTPVGIVRMKRRRRMVTDAQNVGALQQFIVVQQRNALRTRPVDGTLYKFLGCHCVLLFSK